MTKTASQSRYKSKPRLGGQHYDDLAQTQKLQSGYNRSHYGEKENSSKEVFQLNSLKDDRSVLQEDLISRKTNDEKTNLENELKILIEPEFIRQIGLTKNGEVIL